MHVPYTNRHTACFMFHNILYLTLGGVVGSQGDVRRDQVEVDRARLQPERAPQHRRMAGGAQPYGHNTMEC